MIWVQLGFGVARVKLRFTRRLCVVNMGVLCGLQEGEQCAQHNAIVRVTVWQLRCMQATTASSVKYLKLSVSVKSG